MSNFDDCDRADTQESDRSSRQDFHQGMTFMVYPRGEHPYELRAKRIGINDEGIICAVAFDYHLGKERFFYRDRFLGSWFAGRPPRVRAVAKVSGAAALVMAAMLGNTPTVSANPLVLGVVARAAAPVAIGNIARGGMAVIGRNPRVWSVPLTVAPSITYGGGAYGYQAPSASRCVAHRWVCRDGKWVALPYTYSC